MARDHFAIVISTLCEREQYGEENVSSDQKVKIVRALDAFGVECPELTSPYASPQSEEDARLMAGLGL